MIRPQVRAALPPLAVTAVLIGGAAWLWPESGSPTIDQAVNLCRQQVADHLREPSPTFGDVQTRRNGNMIEVTGEAITYKPLAKITWTCHAHGRYPGEVRVDDVQVASSD